MIKTTIIRKFFGIFAFHNVYIVALIGKPGTGKSHHSQRIASELNLELIIDDGLLIKDSRIVGGRSAKNDQTRIAATKTAIFINKDQCESAKACIQEGHISRVLILGTSLKMVNRIANQLGLGKICKIIRTEEILTPNELQSAQNQRKALGRHIIPVPAMEVHKRYPTIFFDSVQMVIKKYKKNGSIQKMNLESSIVRPKFGDHCTISISENAIRQMITSIVSNINKDIFIKNIKIKWVRSDACRILLNVTLRNITNMSKEIICVSESIKTHIESSIGLVVEMVDISISSVESSNQQSEFLNKNYIPKTE